MPPATWRAARSAASSAFRTSISCCNGINKVAAVSAEYEEIASMGVSEAVLGGRLRCASRLPYTNRRLSRWDLWRAKVNGVRDLGTLWIKL